MRRIHQLLIVLGTTALLASVVAAQVPAPKKRPPAKPVVTAPKVEPPPAPKVEPPPPPPPPRDVQLTTAYTQGAQISTNVTYIRGPRQRIEFPGLVAIEQCDLRRSVTLNVAAKRYRAQAYPAAPAPTTAAPATPMAAMPAMPASPVFADPQMAQMAQMAQAQMTQAQMAQMGQMGQASPTGPPGKGGVVTVVTTLSDTLERQQMFGFEARRVKTFIVKQASATACDKSPLKVEIDAWYVDLPQQDGCARPADPPPAVHAAPGSCTDRLETRVVGDVKLGFPVKTVTTTTTGEGEKLDVSTTTQEVTALEITRLDAALFDVPADFVEAKSSAEIVPSLVNGGSLSDVMFGSTVDGSSKPTPKKPGLIRVGILEPTNKTARSLATSGLRLELVSRFSKPPYEALPVAGTTAAAAQQDATRLGCDYLLVTEITDLKTSKPGKLGSMMKMTGGGPPKDVQEAKVDYKLFAVGAGDSAKVSGNAKASSGGFTVGSALRLAAFAGQLYFMGMGGMNGMGSMGMMGGMMNPMMGLSQSGALGAMGGAFYDPRAMVMVSMASALSTSMTSGMGGMGGLPGDPAEADMRDTVSEALSNEAKSTMEQLKKR